MWSCVGRKKHSRRLSGALDHQTGPDTSVGLRSPGGPGVAETQSLARAAWHSPFLHRRVGCLSPAPASPPALDRQAEDPTARAEASHAAHLDQTVSEENHLLFQLCPDAR